MEQKNEKLIEIEKYKGLNIVTDKTQKNKKVFIAFGNYIIDNTIKSIKEAKKKIDEKPFELYINIASVVAYKTTEKYLENESIKKEEKNEKQKRNLECNLESH